MIQAIIFDMDGLLIDSEPYWRRAEREVFGAMGISLSEEMLDATTGLRTDEVMAFRYRQQPWEGKSLEQVGQEVTERVQEIMATEGQPMAGVEETLAFFQSKGLPLALASSSPMWLIETVVDKLGIRERFSVLCSAEKEPFGKPHPAIYLTTAQQLGVAPVSCLAFEDSFNGLLAAKAARMKAVAVPEPRFLEDPRFGFADLRLPSLAHFTPEHFSQLQNLHV